MALKHSILVATYNQHNLIEGCLDSICTQSTKPFEVVVVDDCSTDRTWDVVQVCRKKYPGMIRAHRNERNLGVFANMNRIAGMAAGDFVNFVSGDDLLPPGILAEYTAFIEGRGLDCREPFIIYTDSEILMPDGTREFRDNNALLERRDHIELTLLCSLWAWDTGLSIGLLRAMPPLREDMGYQADWLQHLQRAIACRGNYRIEKTGYLYRSGVGVTVAEKAAKHQRSFLLVIAEFRSKYSRYIIPVIARFLDFLESYNRYLLAPSAGGYLRMVAARARVRHLPPSNVYRRNLRILIPVGVKRILLKIFKR